MHLHNHHCDQSWLHARLRRFVWRVVPSLVLRWRISERRPCPRYTTFHPCWKWGMEGTYADSEGHPAKRRRTRLLVLIDRQLDSRHPSEDWSGTPSPRSIFVALFSWRASVLVYISHRTLQGWCLQGTSGSPLWCSNRHSRTCRPLPSIPCSRHHWKPSVFPCFRMASPRYLALHAIVQFRT